MKQHPLLCNGPMVRALLDGSKTKTRRDMKLPMGDVFQKLDVIGTELHAIFKHGDIRCPYGQPGDQLWVRETFATIGIASDRVIAYKASSPNLDDSRALAGCWKPSIHMPRWASRITLEITDVRVERLQDISGKDILAEGSVERYHTDDFGRNPVSRFDGKVYLDLKSLWANGWESINGAGSWALNPLVWVIEFRRIEP